MLWAVGWAVLLRPFRVVGPVAQRRSRSGRVGDRPKPTDWAVNEALLLRPFRVARAGRLPSGGTHSVFYCQPLPHDSTSRASDRKVKLK